MEWNMETTVLNAKYVLETKLLPFFFTDGRVITIAWSLKPEAALS